MIFKLSKYDRLRKFFVTYIYNKCVGIRDFMPGFSERMGIKPMRIEILSDSVNDEIRNGLWNCLLTWYLNAIYEDYPQSKWFIIKLWDDYFKWPIDTIPNSLEILHDTLRKYFFQCEWYKVYDFVEFVANNYHPEWVNDQNKMFMISCNSILERELSAYRFVGGILSRITAEEEIAEVDKALEETDSIKPINVHIKRAIELFADKKKPDYRNSIKESISAVEAICNLIIGSDHSTLGEALKKIESKVVIHPALKSAFSALYGYTSSADGIRHALLDQSTLDFEDAKFMLVSCSAFINYLIAKSSKAGIELRKKN